MVNYYFYLALLQTYFKDIPRSNNVCLSHFYFIIFLSVSSIIHKSTEYNGLDWLLIILLTAVSEPQKVGEILVS